MFTGDRTKTCLLFKKHNILRHIGDHCMVMFRKIPLYFKLLSLGDNVWIATGVTFVPHDAIHHMLNNCIAGDKFRENIGCISIEDNVFIGTNSIILPNVTIGPNTIVGAGTLVNKSIGGVYAGVPAKYICSFNEFVKKRRHMSDIKIEKIKGDLSETTVEVFWELYNQKNK